MRRLLYLLVALAGLSACDAPPQPVSDDVRSSRTTSAGALSRAFALSEAYGNVDPVSTTAVWTRQDATTTDPAAFDSVDGIATRVQVVSLTQLTPDRALLVTAARDVDPETGKPITCPNCLVHLSSMMFERDAVGWKIIAREDSAAITNEARLPTAINMLRRSNGGTDLSLAGRRLVFDANGHLMSSPSR